MMICRQVFEQVVLLGSLQEHLQYALRIWNVRENIFGEANIIKKLRGKEIRGLFE